MFHTDPETYLIAICCTFSVYYLTCLDVLYLLLHKCKGKFRESIKRQGYMMNDFNGYIHYINP
jgi:hypothetical protein